MKPKYLPLDDSLYRYLCAQRSGADDPILRALQNENSTLGEESKCQISPEQGSLIQLLVSAIGARSALEIGTFTGYSSICIARGLPPDGRLICIDSNQEWTAVARRFWARAGVDGRIELRLGNAIQQLKALEPGLIFDFAFIDAAKSEYEAYYELVLPRVRPNGLILFDNMLWAGRLSLDATPDEPSGRTIDALNRKLAKDTRVEAVLLGIADGLQICRKR